MGDVGGGGEAIVVAGVGQRGSSIGRRGSSIGCRGSSIGRGSSVAIGSRCICCGGMGISYRGSIGWSSDGNRGRSSGNVDIGFSRDLDIDIGFSRDLCVNIRLSCDLLMNILLSRDLNIDIGFSRDFLMDIFFSGDLGVDVGLSVNLDINIWLSRNLLMDIRLSYRVQVGISNAGIVESCIDSSIRSSSIGHRLVSIGNWSCSSNNRGSMSYGSSSSITIGVRVAIASNQGVGG